jgi:hypothetical protein
MHEGFPTPCGGGFLRRREMIREKQKNVSTCGVLFLVFTPVLFLSGIESVASPRTATLVVAASDSVSTASF